MSAADIRRYYRINTAVKTAAGVPTLSEPPIVLPAVIPRKQCRSPSPSTSHAAVETIELDNNGDIAVPSNQTSRRAKKAPRVSSPFPEKRGYRDITVLKGAYRLQLSLVFLSDVAPAFAAIEPPQYVSALFCLLSLTLIVIILIYFCF